MTSPSRGVGVGDSVMAGRTAVTGGTNTVVGDDLIIPGVGVGVGVGVGGTL